MTPCTKLATYACSGEGLVTLHLGGTASVTSVVCMLVSLQLFTAVKMNSIPYLIPLYQNCHLAGTASVHQAPELPRRGRAWRGVSCRSTCRLRACGLKPALQAQIANQTLIASV